MKKLIFVVSLLLSFNVQAQTHGSPGGGGPDEASLRREIECDQSSELSIIHEREFAKSWEREYKNSQSFNDLLKEIIKEQTLHLVGQEVGSGEDHECTLEPKGKFSERKNFISEHKHLKEIHKIWKVNAVIGSSRYCKDFESRKKSLSDLEVVLKFYEKN